MTTGRGVPLDILLAFARVHILHHAGEEPIFGLGMMEELYRHGYRLGAGTMYPLLHRLHEDGLLSVQTETINGKRRKYYTITARGLVARSNVHEDSRITQPLAFGSHKSKLIAVMRDDAHRSRVDLGRNDWLALVTWIDLNGPYHDGFINKRPKEPPYDLPADAKLAATIAEVLKSLGYASEGLKDYAGAARYFEAALAAGGVHQRIRQVLEEHRAAEGAEPGHGGVGGGIHRGQLGRHDVHALVGPGAAVPAGAEPDEVVVGEVDVLAPHREGQLVLHRLAPEVARRRAPGGITRGRTDRPGQPALEARAQGAQAQQLLRRRRVSRRRNGGNPELSDSGLALGQGSHGPLAARRAAQ